VRAPVTLFLSLVVSLSTLAAEIPISETLRYGPADVRSTTRYAPTVAAGGEGFLVAWEEQIYAGFPLALAFRTYDANGTPQQPEASTLAGDGHKPRAVWTGDSYLLVYATGTRWGHANVYALRISASGALLDPTPGTKLIEETYAASVLDFVWDGQSAWALLQEGAAQRIVQLDAQAQLVSSKSVAGAAALAVTSSREPWVLPAQEGDVAASHRGAIATLDQTDLGVIATLRDEDGRAIEAFQVAPPGPRIRTLAWDGVAWVAAYAAGDQLCTLRFTGKFDLTRECVATERPYDPWIAAGPQRSLLAWTAGPATWSAGHGQVLTSSGIASMSSIAQRFSAATLDPTGLLVAWVEGEKIHVGGLTKEGSRRSEQILDTDPVFDAIGLRTSENASLLAFSARGMIRAIILDDRGVPSIESIILGEAVSPRDGSAPRVLEARRGGWLVTWRTSTEVVSTLVSRYGSSNGLQHYDVSPAQQYAVSATADDEFLLVRTEADRLIAERIDFNGLKTGATTIANADTPTMPVIGCGSKTCLVSWFEGTRRSVVIDHDGSPLSDVHDLGVILPVVSLVRAQPGGGFAVHYQGSVFSLDANGELIGRSSWTDAVIDSLTVLDFSGRPTYVYTRSGRVYVRDFASRSRAVRH
jgi:hypothetical protein